MKYNVGDKVIERDNLYLLFNPYWDKENRHFSTVTEANETYFSIYKPSCYESAIEEGLSCGANEYMVFYQSTGRTKNWASSTTLFHMEKDRDLILEIVNKLQLETMAKELETIKKERISIEARWERFPKWYDECSKLNHEFIQGGQSLTGG